LGLNEEMTTGRAWVVPLMKELRGGYFTPVYFLSLHNFSLEGNICSYQSWLCMEWSKCGISLENIFLSPLENKSFKVLPLIIFWGFGWL
jgi:hypothetical protein